MSVVGRKHRASGQGQQTVERTECAICGKAGYWGHRFDDRHPAHPYKPVERRYVSLDAAVAAIIERYCDTSRGILCSDFRQAADFLREEFGSPSSPEALKGEQG